MEMASRKLPFNRVAAPRLHYAEDYRQLYLAKNPNGYWGIGGWGVAFKLSELQVREKA
jgi:peptide methionine sulfoxide reductase MsrA